jgi:hypothetical protein
MLRTVLITMLFISICAVPPNPDDKKHLADICGRKLADKLLEYSAFHAEVLEKKRPQRYLVSVAVEAGLADRLLGMMSQFWLAFFSKRAFQIAGYDKLPHFEYAYDYRFINWTRPPDPPQYTANLLYTYRGKRGYDGPRNYDNSVDKEKYFPDYMINKDGRCADVYKHMDLEKYPEDSKAYPVEHTVFTSSNRGGIHYMFENPKMKAKLEEVGMDKYSAFRCAYGYLFRENAEVEQVTEPYRQALLQRGGNHSALRIGIGIRAGDQSFDPRLDAKLTPSVYQRFTQCAEKIEATYFEKHPEKANSRSSWFVMAESLHTRRMIAQQYKDKVVTDIDNSYFHGDCGHHRVGGCDQQHLKDAIVHAASQLQLFSMCNVHIVADSGFPRSGSFLGNEIPKVFVDFNDCTYGKFDSNDRIMTMGAGMRHV